MTEHKTLFAIKLMLKSLRYSDTTIQPIIKMIDNLIEAENYRCTDEWKKELQDLNELIEKTV